MKNNNQPVKYGDKATVTTSQGDRVTGTVANNPQTGVTYVRTGGYTYSGRTEETTKSDEN